jgi:predicted AlkP superfamily phosphohydrolase/phosphomutase/tetratricopeptide (TPR) repeat protein
MKKRLLLIGWDSADWKLIHPLLDAGKLPGVARLVEGGISGNLATLEPQLSPMLWTSIATGKMAYHHGVQGFTEVDPVSGRIVPVSAATRRCKTLWEMLCEHGLRSHVVSWFATQGEQDLRGKVVSNMYGHLKGVSAEMDPSEWPPPMPGTYWPPSLAAELDERRISPADITGEVIGAFVPDGRKVDQQRDRRLQNLAEKLAEAYSVQAAACHVMQSDPDWDFMAVYFRAIDEISHFFMPYHPPKMEGIPQADFDMYQHVVNGAYQAHDMMLQRLIDLAGPDTAIVLVSDHGFHSDHLRPKFTPRVPAGITVWHRSQGVIMAKGPGFKEDELVHGACLLDIAPTVLHYFGLPVGTDMEGRVLSECFADPRPVESIPTWEDEDGHRTRTRGSLSAADSEALLEQFVALGYIDEVSADPTEAADETNRENKWNLARACLYGGKYELALPLLEDCFTAYPERTDYAQLLARCQFQLGLLDEAEETLEVCLEGFGANHGARLVMGGIELARGRHAAGLAHLEAVRAADPDHPQLLQGLADAYLALRRWEDARATAARMLELDPGSSQAHLTLARVFFHLDRAEEAADAALEAVGLQFGNPRGHFLLGVALMKLQNWPAAAQAFRNHLRLKPHNGLAARYLAQACRALGQVEEAEFEETRSRVLRQKNQSEAARRVADLRGAAGERATLRQAERQRRREEAAAKAAEEAAVEEMEFTLVSGLPRSGTSLMMQLLRAGGLDLMHDGKRVADADNEEGYWEWEEIKSLKKNPRVIEQAAGKAIKIISALLPSLPPKHRYKIVFMRRPVAQVVESQWKMLERSGQQPKSEKAHLIATQERHVEQLLATLRQSPRVELLEVDFPGLIAEPAAWLPRLQEFLGAAVNADPAALAAVVRPDLHHHRDEAVAS